MILCATQQKKVIINQFNSIHFHLQFIDVNGILWCRRHVSIWLLRFHKLLKFHWLWCDTHLGLLMDTDVSSVWHTMELNNLCSPSCAIVVPSWAVWESWSKLSNWHHTNLQVQMRPLSNTQWNWIASVLYPVPLLFEKERKRDDYWRTYCSNWETGMNLPCNFLKKHNFFLFGGYSHGLVLNRNS